MSMRVFLGPGMFRVSKPGYNANTATDSQLIFKESARSASPGVIGTITVGAQQTVGIPLPDPGWVPLILTRYEGGGATYKIYLNAERSAVYFQNVAGDLVTSFTLRYWIFNARGM